MPSAIAVPPLTLHKPGVTPKKAFVYEVRIDGYRCPEGQLLAYVTPVVAATATTRAI